MPRKQANIRPKTWQEKLVDGEPLSLLEEVQADADFNVKRHLREQRERAQFEARKRRSREGLGITAQEQAPQPVQEQVTEEEV